MEGFPSHSRGGASSLGSAAAILRDVSARSRRRGAGALASEYGFGGGNNVTNSTQTPMTSSGQVVVSSSQQSFGHGHATSFNNSYSRSGSSLVAQRLVSSTHAASDQSFDMPAHHHLRPSDRSGLAGDYSHRHSSHGARGGGGFIGGDENAAPAHFRPKSSSEAALRSPWDAQPLSTRNLNNAAAIGSASHALNKEEPYGGGEMHASASAHSHAQPIRHIDPSAAASNHFQLSRSSSTSSSHQLNSHDRHTVSSAHHRTSSTVSSSFSSSSQPPVVVVDRRVLFLCLQRFVLEGTIIGRYFSMWRRCVGLRATRAAQLAALVEIRRDAHILMIQRCFRKFVRLATRRRAVETGLPAIAAEASMAAAYHALLQWRYFCHLRGVERRTARPLALIAKRAKVGLCLNTFDLWAAYCERQQRRRRAVALLEATTELALLRNAFRRWVRGRFALSRRPAVLARLGRRMQREGVRHCLRLWVLFAVRRQLARRLEQFHFYLTARRLFLQWSRPTQRLLKANELERCSIAEVAGGAFVRWHAWLQRRVVAAREEQRSLVLLLRRYFVEWRRQHMRSRLSYGALMGRRRREEGANDALSSAIASAFSSRSASFVADRAEDVSAVGHQQASHQSHHFHHASDSHLPQQRQPYQQLPVDGRAMAQGHPHAAVAYDRPSYSAHTSRSSTVDSFAVGYSSHAE